MVCVVVEQDEAESAEKTPSGGPKRPLPAEEDEAETCFYPERLTLTPEAADKYCMVKSRGAAMTRPEFRSNQVRSIRERHTT
jgi:hypothetical protein